MGVTLGANVEPRGSLTQPSAPTPEGAESRHGRVTTPVLLLHRAIKVKPDPRDCRGHRDPRGHEDPRGTRAKTGPEACRACRVNPELPVNWDPW
ncbi:hypothetical protein CRUP_027507 [Coryphaenoides rupestris]|nr:hypothetical protein CRUP_027507 [Coryphaenoides rupestris]